MIKHISRRAYVEVIQEWLIEQPEEIQFKFRSQIDAVRNYALVYRGVVISEQEAWVQFGRDMLKHFKKEKE